MILACVGEARAADPPASAFAQARAQARTLEIRRMPPFAGYSMGVALINNWEVMTFYDAPSTVHSPGGVRWVARHVVGQIDRRLGVEWADSDKCPGMRSALEDLESLPAPLAVPRLHPNEQSTEVTLDGASFALWVDTRWSGMPNTYGHVEMSGPLFTPLADWVSATDDRLAHCWAPAMPANFGD